MGVPAKSKKVPGAAVDDLRDGEQHLAASPSASPVDKFSGFVSATLGKYIVGC
jgi:hypothetical protein